MKVGYIQTSFWGDPFIQELEPDAKLLFIYLRTNTRTSICGMYEISLRTMEFETGIKKKRIEEILAILEKAEKVRYHIGYIYLINMVKHMHKPSPQLLKGIENEKNKLPSEILAYFSQKKIPYTYPIDTPRDITPPPPPSPPPSQSPNGDSAKAGKRNTEIDKMLEALKGTTGRDDFKESQKMQRWYGKHLVNLYQKVGKEEFKRRLEFILSDDFKVKNCNSLKYLYGELKSASSNQTTKSSVAHIS